MGNRADVQQVGHAHRQHLAELPVEGVRPPETELCKTTGGAGEPGEEGGGREEDLPNMTSSVQLSASSSSSPRMDATHINRPVPACFVSRRSRSCTGTKPERSRTGRRPRPHSPAGTANNAPAPSGTAAGEPQHCNMQPGQSLINHLILKQDQINVECEVVQIPQRTLTISAAPRSFSASFRS